MPKLHDAAPLIEFDRVSFSYEPDTPVLDGVTLAIAQGEFVCVIGANGSGKSTLARLACALALPDEGTVQVCGHNTTDARATTEIRSNVALVFQNPDEQLVATLVEDEVAFGPANLGIVPDELRKRVDEALELTGCGGWQKRKVTTLSGGQKQLVALAGALAMHPRVLIADEATAMLDPAERRKLMNVLAKLNSQGTTVVCITHFADEAARAERVVVLSDGHVCLDGAPDDVLTRADILTSNGLSCPNTVQLAHALRERGQNVPLTLSQTELEEAVCRLLSKA